MKTSTYAPSVDHFTIPSLALLAKKQVGGLLNKVDFQRSVGLSLSDISEASAAATATHGLKVRRSALLRMNW